MHKKKKKFLKYAQAAILACSIIGTTAGAVSAITSDPVPDGVAARDYNASLPPLIPGYYSVTLDNETKGAYPDDQVFIQFLATNRSDGNILTWDLYKNQKGAYPSVRIYEAYAGRATTLPSFTLADLKNGTFYVPIQALDAARLYISLGKPLQSLQVLFPNYYSQPDFDTSTGVDVNTPFEWLEFGYDPSAQTRYIYNITQVDAFAIPIWFKVTDVLGNKNPITGVALRDNVYSPSIIASRDSIINSYQSYATGTKFSLDNLRQGALPINGSPARILAPVHNAALVKSNYFDSAFDDFWKTYQSTAANPRFHMCTQDAGIGGDREDGDCFKGFVDTAGNFNFWHYLPRDNYDTGSDCPGTSKGPRGAYCVFRNPVIPLKPDADSATKCALNANCFTQVAYGTFEGILNTQFMGAINRGVAATSYEPQTGYTRWNNNLVFYPPATKSNTYAHYWHTISPGGRAYGFSYDDAGNQSSSYGPVNQVQNITIGVGW